MKITLTLGERLKDLRSEKDMTLSQLAEATGIPLATLQRLESKEDYRAGHPDITILAKFYGVSADYLFDLTDDRKHRNVDVDALHISDDAIAVLKDGKLNNRLLCELITHSDFPRLLRAMEIYIDRKVLPQMKTMNAMYKFVEQSIKENANAPETDEMLLFLQQSVVDEDEYLLYRISERFSKVMKSLFETHEKDKQSPEQPDMLSEMKGYMDIFTDAQRTESEAKAKAIVLASQLGLDTTKLTDEEWRVLIKTLESAPKANRQARRKFGR